MWKKNSNIYNFGPAESHYAIHTHHLDVKSIFSIEGHLKVFILTILCMQQTNTNIIPWGTLLFFLYWSYLPSVTPLVKLWDCVCSCVILLWSHDMQGSHDWCAQRLSDALTLTLFTAGRRWTLMHVDFTSDGCSFYRSFEQIYSTRSISWPQRHSYL